ncbi:hypothetical protein ACFPOI_35280 [Nonomuraea angiospora]|uniref:DUF5753 domain-containing protein n=1 Tax=Nonomuraea angiospora TaxID=46172 RepID=A0ABR9M8E1_9ACTN|nr:hypothetical protein [Nonomuraea angiospora]MBE1589178.1 hypothetical protein [Nonomuraea angiospora]
MSLGPYTYVTLSIAHPQSPRLNVSFHTSDLRVRSSVIDERRPYLAFTTSEADVSVSTTGGGPVTDADLTLAREIYNAAAHYLADCERLHGQQSITGKATEQTAA